MPAIYGAESQDRTGDTAIFSRVLYRLSYLGLDCRLAARRRDERYHDRPKRCKATRLASWQASGRGGRQALERTEPSRRPYSRPVSWRTSRGSMGASPVSCQRRLMRSTMGGWVEKRAPPPPSFFSGLTM